MSEHYIKFRVEMLKATNWNRPLRTQRHSKIWARNQIIDLSHKQKGWEKSLIKINYSTGKPFKNKTPHEISTGGSAKVKS